MRWGGVGFSGSIILKHLRPRELFVNDISDYAFAMLVKNLEPKGARVWKRDLYETNFDGFDCVTVDFNRFTALHLARYEYTRQLFGRLMSGVSNVFTITDSAQYGLYRYSGRNSIVYDNLFNNSKKKSKP